jgi:hypothetical protein
MSTIKANTLLHSDGSTTTQPSIPALDTRMAQAWCNLDMRNTSGIRGSFGISSVTDIGTGQFRFTLSTAMPNVNYAAVGSTSRSGQTNNYHRGYDMFIESTSQVRVITWDSGSSVEDHAVVSMAVFSS